MNILLLEDNLSLNKAILNVLQLEHHKVSTYTNGIDVFNDLDKEFDLYILDINVPGLNGLKLLDIIYKKDNNAKVIIISSNSDVYSLKQAYKLGCIDYLNKPFHLEELQIKIDKLDIKTKFDISTLKLKDGKELTKREKDFLNLLFKNINKLTSYEMIEQSVYKDKVMSMNSLRAMVKRLKSKLSENIIKNIRDEGYSVEEY